MLAPRSPNYKVLIEVLTAMKKWAAPIAGTVLGAIGAFTPYLQPMFVKYPWLGPALAGVGIIAGSLAPQPQKS